METMRMDITFKGMRGPAGGVDGLVLALEPDLVLALTLSRAAVVTTTSSSHTEAFVLVVDYLVEFLYLYHI